MTKTLVVACLLLAASTAVAQSSQPCSAYFEQEDRLALESPEIADSTAFQIVLKHICASGQVIDMKKKMIACAFRRHLDAIQTTGQKLGTAEQMVQDGSLPDMPICNGTTTPTVTDQKKPQPYYSSTTVEGLKKAIDAAQSAPFSGDDKLHLIDLAIKMWKDSRMITSAAYEENLDKALDAWYLNNKNWRKIQPELWNKLSERDRGRLKDGVDPELMVLRRDIVQHEQAQ